MKKNILFVVIIVGMLSLFITSCSSNEEGTIIELNQSSDDIALDKEAEVLSIDSNGQKEETFLEGDSKSKTVIIENMKFIPTDFDVKIGDTVEWINKDSVKHTVTFEDARFDVQVAPGESVIYTFETAGEARYFCAFHPGMAGSVVIK